MLGDNIKHAREEAGLTQAQLAKAIRKSPPLVSLVESNKANPSLATLRNIAKALGVQVQSLLATKRAA